MAFFLEKPESLSFGGNLLNTSIRITLSLHGVGGHVWWHALVYIYIDVDVCMYRKAKKHVSRTYNNI